MLAAGCKLKQAQKVKNFIIKNNLFDHNYLPVKELGFIYFPIIKKVQVPGAKVSLVKFKFPEKIKILTVTELLKKKLTKNQLKLVPRTQEIVGTIMLLEMPEELQKQEKLIAQAYLKLNKNITTIVKKEEMHSGVCRLRKVKVLAGKKTKETIHLESGIRIKLDLEKTYFSARLANERLRIAKLIKTPEEVLVMFSGAAPYPLVLAKNSCVKSILGIEINLLAHRFAMENVRLNKLENKIKIKQGNVRNVLPRIRKKFDRILMPLPKTGEEFLDLALKKAKPGAIIHLYAFLDEKEVKEFPKKIQMICKENKNSVRIVKKVKCGQFSPAIARYCFDLKVSK